jgi:lambda family phage portal protein
MGHPAYKQRWRERASAQQGGYTGARIDRAALAAWRTFAGSPQTDVIVDLPMLRQRAADLERNAPVAASIVNTTAQHVVGTGLSCNPQIDAEFLGLSEAAATAWQKNVRRRFRAWSECPDCSLDRTLDFYGVQDLSLRSTLSRGDVFVVTPRVARAGKRPVLALQTIEADRVSNPRGQRDSDTLTDGVEVSDVTGEAIAYHVTNRHPGELVSTKSLTWQRVAARGDSTGRRNVLHLFKQLRPGLRRGVPVLAPVIEQIKQLTKYTESELAAAVTSSLFSVFLRMDPQAFDDMFDDAGKKTMLDKAAKWSGELEAGQAINLLPGEEPVTVNPARPNEQFDPFVSACFQQIGMAIGIPKEVLTMHFQSSYSAARGALLMAWRFFMGWRNWMATSLCQPVYELWLADEVAEGRIAAPGFFSDDVVRHAWCGAQWVGDGPGSIDPQKEVAAAQARVDMGISTLEAESILHDGVDWDTKHRQQVKEAAARKGAGLKVAGEAPPPPAPPAEPSEREQQQRRRDDDQAAAQLQLTLALADDMVRDKPAPVINVAAPVVNVQPPDVHVNVEAPQIHVEAPAPPAPPQAYETTVVRDEVTGLIVSKTERVLEH